MERRKDENMTARYVEPVSTATHLALDLLSLVDDADMPDSFRLTDSRVLRALMTLDHAGLERPEGWKKA